MNPGFGWDSDADSGDSFPFDICLSDVVFIEGGAFYLISDVFVGILGLRCGWMSWDIGVEYVCFTHSKGNY